MYNRITFCLVIRYLLKNGANGRGNKQYSVDAGRHSRLTENLKKYRRQQTFRF